MAHTAEQIAYVQVHALTVLLLDKCILNTDSPFDDLPEGGIADLEKRMTQFYRQDRSDVLRNLGRAERLVQEQPSGEIILRDGWGNALVYEFPAPDAEYVFFLYSVGPNGKDEKRGGDDIDASLTYKTLSPWLEDPNFDGNTYRKHRGKLTFVWKKGDSKIHHP